MVNYYDLKLVFNWYFKFLIEKKHLKQLFDCYSCTSFYKGRLPLRKISIGSNRTGLLPSCIIHTAGPKKVENNSTLYHWGSNWNRKLVPKPMSGFNFVPIRSDAYFPEWNLALRIVQLLTSPTEVKVIFTMITDF